MPSLAERGKNVKIAVSRKEYGVYDELSPGRVEFQWRETLGVSW